MPKIMLKPAQKITENNICALETVSNNKQNLHESNTYKLELDRILRKKRSKEYMDALHNLDAGGHVQNQQKVNEIIDTIKKEFPEAEIFKTLLGYVSICYLGKPYEVHTLDMPGQIISHFKYGQPLPDGMEKARGIALRGGYAFIEVYTDCCRAVNTSGIVSVIK
ncbi:MAG: hypothetical protein HFH68_03075 [Lachnospiraceae bacterium]|nr:hypothetical protein [Lachnospiraceae bacterium]